MLNSSLLTIKSLLLVITTIFISCLNIAHSNDYALEILVIKQPQDDQTKIFSNSYQLLPSLNDIEAVYTEMGNEPTPDTRSEVETEDLPHKTAPLPTPLKSAINRLQNKGYQVIYHNIITKSLDPHQKHSFMITNQQDFAHKVQVEEITNTDYYARTHFLDTYADNLLIGKISIERVNEHTIDTSINLINQFYEQSEYKETKIDEKRKIHEKDINYFDNPSIAVLATIHKIPKEDSY